MPEERPGPRPTRPSAPKERFPTDEEAPAPRRGDPEEGERRERGDPSGERGDRMPRGADEPGAGL